MPDAAFVGTPGIATAAWYAVVSDPGTKFRAENSVLRRIVLHRRSNQSLDSAWLAAPVNRR